MTLLATPSPVGLVAPIPWMSELCCPTALLPLYRMPHVHKLELPGRISPWVGAFMPQYAIVYRGLAGGIQAPHDERVADFMRHLLTAQIPRYRYATVGDLQAWCQLPSARRSPCGPPCNGSGLICEIPPVVCPRCGGFGVGEEREDGFGWLGSALIDRRELARVLEHIGPAETVDLGTDEAGELWICGDVFRIFVIGLDPERGKAAPKFEERTARS